MWENIKSLYQSVQYSIKIDNRIMNPITSNLGLKQGCPLSPLLFNLYINNITQHLQPTDEDDIKLQQEKITHFMYADDLVIVSSTSNGLQDKLDKLSKFADTKDLSVNAKKSQVMIFNKAGKLLKKNTFTINGQKLDIVRKYTYLGVDIPSSGTFSTSIAELTSKAKKAMMPLYTTIMQFNIPFHKAIRLFQTYIEPILLYNAENQTTMTDLQIQRCQQDRSHIYHLQQTSPLTTTQLKFSKFILGVGKQCPNMSIFGETAAIPFLARAHIHMLKFWNRIKEMDKTTLVNMAYRENIRMNTNWCKTIQVLNATYNLHSRESGPEDFPELVKKTIYNDFTGFWKSRITDPSLEKKLSLYAKTKKDFRIDAYTDLPFKDRQIISKFLCVSHKLKIETGRHLNVPREERICELCTLNNIEDEEHFITKCPAYATLRAQYFGENCDIQSMTQDPKNLASFLRKAYSKRDEILEEQPKEQYHVAHKNRLKMTLRKGPKLNKISNVDKDGMKIKITNT